MEKDKLEQYILNNRKSFEPPEVTPDVWSKIKKNQSKKNRFDVNWRYLLSRAAAVVAIFVSSYYFHEYRSNKSLVKIDNQAKNEKVYQELMESELYYTSQIKAKENELFLLTKGTPSIKKDIVKDFTGLDNILMEIKNDLKDNADNQEVIEAVMQNYMLKLEILEDMLSQIKSTNKHQTYHEEGYNI